MPDKAEKTVISPLSTIKAKKAQSKSDSRLTSFSVNNVEKLKTRNEEDLVFSFLLLDTKHEAFNFGGVCSEWHETLFDVLKDLSGKKWTDIQLEDHYDAHKHNFQKTNFIFNFDRETLDQFEGCQFGLGKSKGRIHGFLIGNRFYVYWVDPNHNMNDSAGYEGLVFKVPVETCYKVLNDANIDLLYRNNELLKRNAEIEETYDKFLDEYEKTLKRIEDLEKENNRLNDIVSSEAKKRENYNKKIRKRYGK